MLAFSRLHAHARRAEPSPTPMRRAELPVVPRRCLEATPRQPPSRVCKHLLPSGGTGTPQQRQQKFAFALKVARSALAGARVSHLPRPGRSPVSRSRRGIDTRVVAVPGGGDDLREAGREGSRPAVESRAAVLPPARRVWPCWRPHAADRTATRVAHGRVDHAQSASAASVQGNGAIAFSRCMRSHGVSAYPDPGTGGLLPKKTPQQLGVAASVLQAAQRACMHLVPNGGRPTPAQVQQYKSVMLTYARCIRAHGVPNMPDPDSRGHLDIGPGSGIEVNSPRSRPPTRHASRGSLSDGLAGDAAVKALSPNVRRRLLGVTGRAIIERATAPRTHRVTAGAGGLSCSRRPAAARRRAAWRGSAPREPDAEQLQHRRPASAQADAAAVAFSRCMRSHGVPTFPDPTRQPGCSQEDTAATRGQQLRVSVGPAMPASTWSRTADGATLRPGAAVPEHHVRS